MTKIYEKFDELAKYMKYYISGRPVFFRMKTISPRVLGKFWMDDITWYL